jgi:hypothetical protein
MRTTTQRRISMIGSMLDLEPRTVKVELLPIRIVGGGPLRGEMKYSEAHIGSFGDRDHHASMSPARPVSDSTVRAKPRRFPEALLVVIPSWVRTEQRLCWTNLPGQGAVQ